MKKINKVQDRDNRRHEAIGHRRQKAVGDKREKNILISRLIPNSTSNLLPKLLPPSRGTIKVTERPDSNYDFYVIVDDNAANPLLLTDAAYSAIHDMDRKSCDILIHRKSHFEERKIGLRSKILSQGKE